MNGTLKARMCGTKKKYPSALAAIRACIDTSFKWGKPMRHYKCGICGSYHITSSPR